MAFLEAPHSRPNLTPGACSAFGWTTVPDVCEWRCVSINTRIELGLAVRSEGKLIAQ